MQTTSTQQPPQPPKESAYNQPSNPVSHNPIEQRDQRSQPSNYGNPVPSIIRGAGSKPSTNSTTQKTSQRHSDSLNAMHREADVDIDYGVEQQPNEGAIANAVESQSRHKIEDRAHQAGAHAGPVGRAQGPGAPAFGEGVTTLENLDEKGEEHRRILGERVGRTPPGGSEEERREEGRERRLRQDRELHPADVVGEATGDPVAGR
ncbi:hypothetical protein BJY01DRAFT_6648 [Aspergillus pseudoustus]|uniref:Uncharacterized protein n=1 Tax=Aspergillus pseudoustus TaxID=1810923 RepID=A0ABR4JQL5_9EURO